jgi:hypothetical protein
LQVAARELAQRLVKLFLPDGGGQRACHGKQPGKAQGERSKDMVLFHEYFHGETGQGLGASHQTGWTALVARLIEGFCTEKRSD